MVDSGAHEDEEGTLGLIAFLTTALGIINMVRQASTVTLVRGLTVLLCAGYHHRFRHQRDPGPRGVAQAR